MNGAPVQLTSLHLTNAYHPTSGGIRTFYRAALAGAEARGRQMHLVVPGEHDGEERVGRNGWIHHVAAPPAPGFDRRYRLLAPRHYVRSDAPVRRLLATIRPDVVEICDKYTLPHAAWLLRRAGPRRPTLVALSCERMDDNVAAYLTGAALMRQGVAIYMRHAYVPPFDAHLANSAYTADELRSAGAAKTAIHLCGMGVDADAFVAATFDASLRARLLTTAGGTAQSMLLLYAGRVSPEKHLGLLIEAVTTLSDRRPDVRLAIVGDGPAVPRLRDLATSCYPGRVAFLPHVADRRALAQHYAAADVFVHPNPREPFGIGPLEAMAAGTPVVVPRAGGVLAYADDGNAWLADPGATGLARAIGAALAAGRRDRRIERARQTARDHEWAGAIDRYFDALGRVHTARLVAQRPGGAIGSRQPPADSSPVALTRSRAHATTPGQS
jgi:alpha-1,6-mannosyltransferase